MKKDESNKEAKFKKNHYYQKETNLIKKSENAKDSQKNKYEKPITKSQDELIEIISRRNRRLQQLFKTIGLPVKVIGNKNTPTLIIDDKSIINAYVHNFELRFTDGYYHGSSVVYTVKLTEMPSYDKEKILSCIRNYEMKPVFRIAVENSGEQCLYLSGYNFLNKEEKLGRYPVFSSYNPKIYFTKEKAEEICSELEQDGYKLMIV